MPNRIIKESICVSESIDALSWFDEVFFYRLIVNCDDYGRFDGRPAVLKARLFPLKESIDTGDIDDALANLVKAGMVTIYEHEHKPYLQLLNWPKHQSIRNKRSKYPDPNAHACICTQLHANVPVIQSESESESESNYKSESKAGAEAPTITFETAPNAFADSLDLPRPDSLEAYISNYVASVMTTAHWQQLDDILASGTPDNLVRLAIDEACAQGKATWAYVYSILNRWTTAGVKTVAQARQQQAQFKASRTQPHSRDRPPDRPGGGGQPKFFDGGADA